MNTWASGICCRPFQLKSAIAQSWTKGGLTKKALKAAIEECVKAIVTSQSAEGNLQMHSTKCANLKPIGKGMANWIPWLVDEEIRRILQMPLSRKCQKKSHAGWRTGTDKTAIAERFGPWSCGRGCSETWKQGNLFFGHGRTHLRGKI